MEYPKILILVVSSDEPPHDVMVKAVKETWGRWKCQYLETMYYWGDRRSGEVLPRGSTKIVGSDILIGSEISIYSILERTLLAYKFLLEHFEFDYVFRCCSGCFVIPPLLLAFASKKPRNRLWCGVTDTTSFNHPFVSGAGVLMSRDIVKMISDNAQEIKTARYPSFMEDVCIAWFLTRAGVVPDPEAPRADDTDNIVPGCHHYHFRTNPEFMRTLHRKLMEGAKYV